MSISLEDTEYRQWQLRHIREEDKDDLIKWLFDGNLKELLEMAKENKEYRMDNEVFSLELKIKDLEKEIEKLKAKEK